MHKGTDSGRSALARVPSLRQTWSMGTGDVEVVDIGFVRHQLDDLVGVRCMYGWNAADVERYRVLCEMERSLLWAH